MGEIVYILLIIAITLTFILYNQQKMEDKKQSIKAPFKKKWANKIYELSYGVPFVWFIDEEETSLKTKEVKEKLAQANLTNLFNYRSFTTLKVGLLICSFVIFALIVLIIDNGGVIAKFLFNIDKVSLVDGEANSLMKAKTISGLLLLALCLTPNIVLKKRAEIYKNYHLKDIPVVQLFIILMLRSKKPIGEVLFALSKINTRYKEIFENGYRIYLRNKEEGLDYISESFGETKFKETINVLKEMGEYSREESIKLLENNMEQIIEKNNSARRRNDLSNLVYSQSTIAIPFVAIITLCFIPLAVLGITIFQQAGMGF